MTSAFGSVTAVIPNWNRADLLERVLACLADQVYPVERIIVVDNGSTDRSRDVARSAGADLIELTSNAGFAVAVNHALRQARSEWVAILNNDIEIPPSWISTLLAAARAYNAAFATGKLVQAADHAVLDGAFDAVSRGATTWRCGHGRPDGPLWSQPRRIALASFTATVIRRTAFDRVGMLDERFESYLEDTDWGLRCAAAGLSGVYVPGAVGTHIGSATLGAWQKATVRLIARNQILLYSKHFRGGPRWPALVGQLLWTLLAVRRGAGVAGAKGKLQGLRRIGAWSKEPSSWPAIRSTVEESERTIREFQEQTGFDSYWKLYFRLIGT